MLNTFQTFLSERSRYPLSVENFQLVYLIPADYVTYKQVSANGSLVYEKCTLQGHMAKYALF